MRRAARTDQNQASIVSAFRQRGATVQPLHTIGAGCPDLLVGWRGQNYLIEVKDGSKSPSKQRLTDDEKRWLQQWRGQVCIVSNVEQAIELLEKRLVKKS